MLSTCDIFDTAPNEVQVCSVQFRNFGGRKRFSGFCRTIKAEAHHLPVREMVSGPGNGDILVVDAGADTTNALCGDRLASLAVANGWAGLILNGAVRDVEELGSCALGVMAIATTARRSGSATPAFATDVPVEIGGVRFAPGAWVVADENAVIIAPKHLQLMAAASEGSSSS